MIHIKILNIADSSARISETGWLSILVVVLLFILEGCSGDQAEKRYYEGVTLEAGALYVSARRWEGRGLEWLMQRGTQVGLQHSVPATRAIEKATEVTILIHGYHAPDTMVSTYFEGLISHLRNVEGYRSPIIVFDWPSVARHWVELSNNERIAFMQLSQSRHPDRSWEVGAYIADGVIAESVGVDALIALIQELSADRPDLRFNIVAHSMGCYVTSETIRRYPQAMARVRTVIWLAPDLKDDILEDTALANGLSRLEKLYVLYSQNDGVLKWLSSILHGMSRMLGAHGPSNISALPDNVVLHDLTDVLGEDGVHSRYLEKDSAAAALIGGALKFPRP